MYYDPSGYSGEEYEDARFGGDESNRDLSQIEQDLCEIAYKYNNFECVECANEIQKYLMDNGLHGVRVSIKPNPELKSSITTIGLIDRNLIISTNGIHVGIEYEGKIYDNIFRDGILKSEWGSKFITTFYYIFETESF